METNETRPADAAALRAWVADERAALRDAGIDPDAPGEREHAQAAWEAANDDGTGRPAPAFPDAAWADAAE